MDCVKSTHSGHKMIKLETVLKKKTAALQKELAHLESNVLKEWEDLAVEARQVTADYLEQITVADKQLDKQAKEFHAKVDEKKQLQDLKKNNLAILHQQEKMVSDGLEKVKQQIKECEDKLRNGSMESLLQYEEMQKSKKITLPKISPVMQPIFTQGQIDSQTLAEMFGKLTNQAEERKSENETKPQDIPRSAEKGKAALLQYATQKQDERDRKSEKSTPQGKKKPHQQVTVPTLPQRQLMSTPSVQSSFYTGFRSNNKFIACVGSGLAWVKTGERRLQLMDQHGDVMDTIDTYFYFSDFVLSPQGEFLLSNGSKCIRLISPDKKFNKLFTTQWTPDGLCCLHSGDVVVTFSKEGRVVIYSGSGEIVQELDNKLFRRPYRMAQNKVNNDLCICDQGNKNIVALDTSYNSRYQYTGQDLSPMDLCTDSAGRVLIIDYNNSVHILDKDGKFLQFLLTDEQGLRLPVSIDTDNEGRAWVEQFSGKVRVVKYIQ